LAKSSFERRLDEVLKRPLSTADAYERSLATIKEAAASIERWFKAGKNVRVSVEPGYLVNAGQQLNVVIRIPSRNVQDTLFRAYLAMEGAISFDFFGEELIECNTPQEAEQRVLDFLARPEMQLRMRAYKDLALGRS
jgi:hypothetical protein